MEALRRNPRTLAFASLLVVFALAVGIGVLLVPGTADALPACGTHYKYYSTPSHTHQVGFKYYDCDGILQSWWGYWTQYSTSATYCCIAN